MAGFKNGLQKVGDVYHFCFRVHSKQFKGSTRARDLQTARKVLEEMRQEAILGKPLHPAESPTFAALVEEWISIHAVFASRKHIENVELMSRIWLIPRFGKTAIDQITLGMVLEARSRLLEAGRSISTANSLFRVVKLLMNHAVMAGHLGSVPFRIKLLKAQRKPRPTVPASRIPEFLAAVDARSKSPHVTVMLKAMLGLGIRESEALGMRWQWFDSQAKTYIVGKAKSMESRVIPVPNWLWTAIHDMPKTISEWVFPAEDGKPHRSHFCKKVLHSVAEDLGLGNLSQHRLRATFASLHAEVGTPIMDIQGMLGHREITTTMIYIEQTLDAKRKAQENLSQKLGLAK